MRPSVTPWRMRLRRHPGAAAPGGDGGPPPASAQKGQRPRPKRLFNWVGDACSPEIPFPPSRMDDYRRAIELTGANVTMMGTLIGANAMRLMRDVIHPVDAGRIWGGQGTAACPTLDSPGASANVPRRDRNIKIGSVADRRHLSRRA